MFGWFKKSEEQDITVLTRLLEAEQAERRRLEQVASEAKIAKDKEMKVTKHLEKQRLYNQSLANKSQALIHLRAAERYIDSFNQATGARRSELQAIIDGRLEKAANLGFGIKGDITQAIMDLE